jgi:phenylalanyl-tRNA synthetase beta chain
MVCTGLRVPKSWSAPHDHSDFYDLKGDLESLIGLTGASAEFAFEAGLHPALHPGQTATITRKGQGAGVIGALHPSVASEMGFNTPLYLCELDLDVLLEAALPQFRELSKFPEIRRDLAVVVDKTVLAADVMQAVKSAAGTYLTDLRLFDVYTGKGVDPKRKSLALGLTFRDQSRTLGDEDVNLAVGQVIDLLEKNYNAELRN